MVAVLVTEREAFRFSFVLSKAWSLSIVEMWRAHVMVALGKCHRQIFRLLPQLIADAKHICNLVAALGIGAFDSPVVFG